MNEVKDLTKSKQSEIPETDSKRNEIISFNNPEFGKVRTTMIDGLPWFVLKDVCAAFGDQNYRRIASRLDDDEKCLTHIKGVSHIDTPGGVQEMIVVNESGIYSALFAMRPEKAPGVTDEYIEDRISKLKKFTRWVTHEVLPSIRKTGSYSVNGRTEMDKELEFMEMAVKMREAEYKVIEARNNNAEVFMRLADTAYRRDDKRFYQSMACNAAAGCNVMPIFGKIRSDIRTRYTVGDLSVEFECTKDFIKFLIDKLGLDSAEFSICYPSDDGDKSKDFYVYNYDAYLVIREYFKAYGKDRLERILIEHRITDLLPDKIPMGTSLFSVN